MRTSQYAQVRAVQRPDRDGPGGVRGTEWTCHEAIAMSENGRYCCKSLFGVANENS